MCPSETQEALRFAARLCREQETPEDCARVIENLAEELRVHGRVLMMTFDNQTALHDDGGW